MKIAMLPYETASNKYLELMRNAILKLGIEINSFDEVYENKELFDETEYFLLNWYEAPVTNSIVLQLLRMIKKIMKLKRIQRNNKKIVWVMHNKIPHNLNHTFHPRYIMNYLIKNSNNIIIHSKDTRNFLSSRKDYNEIKDKLVYVPHPNYIGAYKKSESSVDEDKLNLLFLGTVQPYKNVDLLVKVFNELNLENVTLTLAGKTSSDEYKDYINGLIDGNKNIKTEFRFIEDDEMQDFIAKSDLLVLPYDLKSSLNSGTIILAFSSKKTVLSPLIATLKDFDNRENYFSYEYVDEESHKKALKENLLKISKMDKKEIQEMGKRSYSIVEKENSLDKISEILSQIFV